MPTSGMAGHAGSVRPPVRKGQMCLMPGRKILCPLASDISEHDVKMACPAPDGKNNVPKIMSARDMLKLAVHINWCN